MVSPPSSAPLEEPSEDALSSSSIGFGTPEALAHVRTLTDVGAMTRRLRECIAYERALDLDLASRRADLDSRLADLEKSSHYLDIFKFDYDHMLSDVRPISLLAEQVIGKVRELDLAQTRIMSALPVFDAMQEREECIEGATKALDREDYESASKCVERFLQIDAKYLRDPCWWDKMMAPKTQLEGIVRKRLAAAVDQQDHASVLRFIRLYCPLGLKDEGLQEYVGYLRKVIGMRTKFEQSVELTHDQHSNQGDFATCLDNLFKDIVLAIKTNTEVFKSLCGEDGILHAILELQEECDSWGSLVLKRYMEWRRLGNMSSEINAQNTSLLAFRAPQGPDPRYIMSCLKEILFLRRLCEHHTEFMLSTIKGLTSVDADSLPRATKAFRSGRLSKVVQEITGYYAILEGFVMVENVRKAISIDEHLPGCLTSSMVDEVFCVLDSCLRRAISTSDISSVVAVLSGASRLLSNKYREALQLRMREPNLVRKLFLGGVGVQKTCTEIATALNNMDVSSKYAVKLKHDIEEQCAKVFPAPADRERLKSCLSELGETCTTFKQALNGGMEQLVATVTPRIRAVLDSVATINYELSDAEYANNDIKDPWVQRLLHAVETYVACLQPLMTANNYDSFVHFVIDFIVKGLEAIMMQKRFSPLGGLQLDKDARALASHFSSMTQRTVRDKFAHLTQIAMILNVEKVSEIL
ncbi:conserved oligomeric Golgi complex subunit 4-like [Rhodamnia argentea]|uniref:Conserved oligomeric Golgi complex subunit 4 n=1 Tax=Rhodamnia argentea TaxID=178133 RepID=A0A8B8NNZ2_9MYRT|nr:conserved oligomeric Golgi complex subunit 4-like [Rhodamnia argentea]